MQKYHDEPKQYKGYLKSALVHTVQGSAALGCIKGPSVASKTEIPV